MGSNEQRYSCVGCEARQKRSVSRSRAGLALKADSQTVVRPVLLLSRLAKVERHFGVSAQARDKIFKIQLNRSAFIVRCKSLARARMPHYAAELRSRCGQYSIEKHSNPIKPARRAFSSPDPPVNMNFLKARAPDFANTFDGKRLPWPTPQKSKTRQNARSSSARRAKRPLPRPSAPLPEARSRRESRRWSAASRSAKKNSHRLSAFSSILPRRQPSLKHENAES